MYTFARLLFFRTVSIVARARARNGSATAKVEAILYLSEAARVNFADITMKTVSPSHACSLIVNFSSLIRRRVKLPFNNFLYQTFIIARLA